MKVLEDKINILNSNYVESLKDDEIDELNKSYYYNYYKNYFIKYNDKIYHYKSEKNSDIIFLVNELIGQIISRNFYLPINSSKLFKDEHDNYFLLTENFIEKGHKYKNISNDIFPNLCFYGFCPSRLEINNLDNFGFIRETCGKKINKTDKSDLIKLLYNLKGMIISDFIRNHKDRILINFMIEVNETHVKLCPLYDFESSFLLANMYPDDNTFNFNLKDKEVVKYIRKDNDFQKLLYIATNINFDRVLEELFDLYGIVFSDEEKSDYSNIIESNKKMIKKYKLLR